MTNTGTGKQGIATLPKRHNHQYYRDRLRRELATASAVTQAMILNMVENCGRHYWTLAGGDPEEFEMLFNGENTER